MTVKIKKRAEYRVSVVNTFGDVFKRTTTDYKAAMLMWRDVDHASHVLYAVLFVDGVVTRVYQKPVKTED